jgi:hypothetical protein
MELNEIFDVVKTANCSSMTCTTHDRDIMLATKQSILEAIKQKWPQEAAMLSTEIDKVTYNLSTL